jgi:sugar phosphate permease
MWVFYHEYDLPSARQVSLAECKLQIKEVISNRNILILGVEGFFRVGVQTAFLTYLILYLQRTLQLSIITAGFFFALAHGSGAIGRITWGLVSDRIFGGQRKKVYLFVALISGISFFIFGHLTPTTPILGIILIVAFLGFTAVGHQGVGLSLLAEVAGKECAGTASGFNQSFYFFGVVLMAPLFGLMVDTFGTYSYAWTGLGLFSFIASGLVSFVREGYKKSYSTALSGKGI